MTKNNNNRTSQVSSTKEQFFLVWDCSPERGGSRMGWRRAIAAGDPTQITCGESAFETQFLVGGCCGQTVPLCGVYLVKLVERAGKQTWDRIR
mmetsp:Transcript_63202/g.73972  ORF Transcript_63202/g.73972 Transcript_63202/m.73972 type:complete len:93 (+) Transcript_63202:231-509(+)